MGRLSEKRPESGNGSPTEGTLIATKWTMPCEGEVDLFRRMNLFWQPKKKRGGE